LNVFSGTMPSQRSDRKRNCLSRYCGEFCVCSEARGCMVEKIF
jgi:hypothetical protein